MAEYLTVLPPKDVLESGLHAAIPPRCTPNTTFETFLFPEALRGLEKEKQSATKNTKNAEIDFVVFVSFVANPSFVAISDAARKLHEARERWLNHLHREVDHAVLTAYGWEDLAEPLFQAEDALRAANPKGEALGLKLGRTAAGHELMKRLLELNSERAEP